MEEIRRKRFCMPNWRRGNVTLLFVSASLVALMTSKALAIPT
jgi:hypothetical protein